MHIISFQISSPYEFVLVLDMYFLCLKVTWHYSILQILHLSMLYILSNTYVLFFNLCVCVHLCVALQITTQWTSLQVWQVCLGACMTSSRANAQNWNCPGSWRLHSFYFNCSPQFAIPVCIPTPSVWVPFSSNAYKNVLIDVPLLSHLYVNNCIIVVLKLHVLEVRLMFLDRLLGSVCLIYQKQGHEAPFTKNSFLWKDRVDTEKY